MSEQTDSSDLSRGVASNPSEIRSLHHNGFRSGEWGRITGVFKYNGRACYRIRWPQHESKPDLETIDYWPVDDPSDEREYR